MTDTVEQLVAQWTNAKEALKAAKQILTREECHALNTESALARHLIPQGAQPGEKFAVWVGDVMVQVTMNANSVYAPTLTIRNRPK